MPLGPRIWLGLFRSVRSRSIKIQAMAVVHNAELIDIFVMAASQAKLVGPCRLSCVGSCATLKNTFRICP